MYYAALSVTKCDFSIKFLHSKFCKNHMKLFFTFSTSRNRPNSLRAHSGLRPSWPAAGLRPPAGGASLEINMFLETHTNIIITLFKNGPQQHNTKSRQIFRVLFHFFGKDPISSSEDYILIPLGNSRGQHDRRLLLF